MLALVVDDSKMARFVLGKMLKQQGIDVYSVESGEEALGYLCNSEPDMIFMDHTMPGMDGFQALRAIKNDPRTSPIPIMMYTSKEGEVYINQARELGAVDVLPKELKPEHLAAVLRKQQLLPSVTHNNEASNRVKTENNTASVIATSDFEEDIAQVAKDAEKSIENKNFTSQVRRLLDDHKDDLAKQAQQRSEGLLEQFDNRLQMLTDRIEQLTTLSQSQQTFWSRLNNGPRLMIMVVFALLVLWGVISNIQKSEQLSLLGSEVAQLREAIKTEDAKAEATKTELEEELKDVAYEQQLQANEWLANFEWAVNKHTQFPWSQKPFNDALAKHIGHIANRLQAAGFSGTIVLTSHLGNFCLTADANGTPAIPEAGQPAANCTINTLPQQPNTLEEEQTMAFNHFMAAFEIQFDNAIKLELATQGNQSPLYDYPDQQPDLLASDWNKVAALNNRISIEFKPD